MKIFLALVMLVGICIADGTETQTDWVGGPGTPGPVTTWGTLFDVSSGISWLTTGEIGLSLEHNISSSSNGPRWAVCGDIDGDSDIDVLVCEYYADSLVWFENIDGDSYFWERHFIGAGNDPHTAALADIDNDGDLDAIAGYYSGDSVVWYENDGTGSGWISHMVVESPYANQVRTLIAAHMNADAFIDIVVPAYACDTVAWYENDGVGGFSWTRHNICATNGPRCGNVADLDKDGYLDVVAGAYYGDSLSWWENDGTGLIWTHHCISSSYNGAGHAWFVDIDGDTYLDVLCAAMSGDSLCWFENTDDIGTSWARHTITTIDYPVYSSFYDLDQDGDQDVLVCSPNLDVSYWFENNGTGTSWVEHLITDEYNGPYFVAGVDINLDGVNEALICDNSSDRVDWYDLFESTGVLESSILDAQEDPDWNTIAWTATTPTNTDAIFQLRSSDNSAAMGSWSADITSPGSIDSYVSDGDNYIQYKAILSTTDVGDSPVIPILQDVTIDWLSVGIAGSSSPADEFTLSIISANPCFGAPVIAFDVPNICNVNLSIFDMSGRVVARIADGEIEAGNYQVCIENLIPGIYHCRMEAGGFTDVRSLVILK
ncbi:MAG: T9SS type A sorting domain-containing protein [Candidatus Aegiribacteria sp.]|nr:T9SS type A sorting domain-containing protein [Candidatus Aegiribacteria sp.]